MSGDKLLSIVIPVYNNFNMTKNCLIDLSYLPSDHEIIVVDDGSTDGTNEKIELLNREYFLKKEKPQLVYQKFVDNGGFARTVNLGFAKSLGQYVMFLNNDIRVKENKQDWTKPIIEAAKGKLVGPTIGVLDKNLNFIKETNKFYPPPYINYISGWNITSDKETWYKLRLPKYIGPFTEEFKHYFEDTDLSLRAKKLGIGFNIIEVPIVHFGRITSKQVGLNKLYPSAKEKFIKKWKEKI